MIFSENGYTLFRIMLQCQLGDLAQHQAALMHVRIGALLEGLFGLDGKADGNFG
jgi:hypothetical protein